MSDVLLGGPSGGTQGVSEHACRRVLAGPPDDVRQRIVRALERLDYRVLSEQSPVLARRGARKDLMAADLLDLSRTLAAGLKPSGAGATLATFDFTVVHGLPWDLGKGDLHTLELEADAIVALANVPEVGGACASCGVENSAEACFCRGCGAPHLLAEPAELELLRVEAGSRAAHQEHVFGLLIMLAVLVVTLPMALLGNPKLARISWVLMSVGLPAGLAMLLYGVRRLHRTLNPKDADRRVLAAPQPPTVPAARPAALHPRPASFSVAEGTTELLGAAPPPRAAAGAPVRARGGDTDPIA